jgi:hypothetical protein
MRRFEGFARVGQARAILAHSRELAMDVLNRGKTFSKALEEAQAATLRIPMNSVTDSDRSRPLVPIEAGQWFRRSRPGSRPRLHYCNSAPAPKRSVTSVDKS